MKWAAFYRAKQRLSAQKRVRSRGWGEAFDSDVMARNKTTRALVCLQNVRSLYSRCTSFGGKNKNKTVLTSEEVKVSDTCKNICANHQRVVK